MADVAEAAAAQSANDIEHVRAGLRKFYGIEATTIDLLDAGSTPNHNVLASSGKRYLVKALRTRLGAWVPENAAKVTALAAFAAKHGVPTPAPLGTLDGALVAIEKGPLEDETTHFVILDWAVGYQRADALVAADPDTAGPLLEQLGGVMARLHLMPIPEDVRLTAPEAPGEHALCDMGTFLECASDPTTLLPGRSTEDAEWFRSWLPKLAAFWKRVSPESAGVCHGDAYLDNVLVKADGPSLDVLLIDWEDACVTNPVIDLAACAVGTCFTLCLGEGTEDVQASLVEARLAALVSGYQKQRALCDADKALLCPAMQACAWACGVFRYGRYLDGVADLKTHKYGQLIEVVKMLDELGPRFDAVAFR